jgi:membrane protein DedA with SNARE-associated domain
MPWMLRLHGITTYDYIAIFVLLMLGIVGLPIPDEPLLVCVCYLSSKGDLSAPLSTVICKEAHQCMNV